MRALRLLLPVTLAVALVPFASAPASAAPPGNDTPDGATVINVGDTVTQDTSEATTDSDDAALNTTCEAPETGASVWYKLTPTTGGDVLMDATASDYSAGLMVFQGTPTADSMLACGPGAVGLHVESGTTYYVMAFSDSSDTGGSLVLSVSHEPPPRARVTIAKDGLAFHRGAAQLHGSYTCAHDDLFSELDAHLLQRAGRLKVQAGNSPFTRCDGRSHPWKLRLVSPVGTYVRGHAVARASLIVCGFVQCRLAQDKRRVHLAWAPRSDNTRSMRPTTATGLVPLPADRYAHWPTSWGR